MDPVSYERYGLRFSFVLILIEAKPWIGWGLKPWTSAGVRMVAVTNRYNTIPSNTRFSCQPFGHILIHPWDVTLAVKNIYTFWARNILLDHSTGPLTLIHYYYYFYYFDFHLLEWSFSFVFFIFYFVI